MLEEGRGRGYIGKSMSVNASCAYSGGAMPISKWRKSTFIEELEMEYDLEVKSIKGSYRNFLKYDGWHHTGALFRPTDFYRIDYSEVESAIKSGRIQFYAEGETITRLAKERALREEDERELELKRNQSLERGQLLVKELQNAEKSERTNKKNNTITTVYITTKQPLLYQAKSEGSYIPLKELCGLAGMKGICELKLMEDLK